MTALDGSIIGIYLLAMLLLSGVLGRRQKGTADYYVGGRRVPGWAVGLSTMATQSSAVSLLGIPAWVALRPGGGLNWLQYEVALPLAMIAVMIVLVPFFRRLEVVTVYEYLERRFGRPTRLLLSGVFLLSRGLATAVAIYGAGIVLAVTLGLEVWLTILLIAGVTVIYDTLGGIEAVIYSDVVQMVVLLGGVLLCIAVALAEVGGPGRALAALPAERLRVIGPGSGMGDGAEAPFWGFLFGGFWLYVSYYGVDQSQVQRELAARSETASRWSLVFNGFGRLPLTLLYLLLGVAVGAVYHHDAALRAAVEARHAADFLVPEFLVSHLPEGLRAVVIAAILAAAMSSLDSALNSLSAATTRDFFDHTDRSGGLTRARWTTLGWGVALTAAAECFALRPGVRTLVEEINRVGSAFYGPVLAVFVCGILFRRSGEGGVIAGVIAGVGANLAMLFFVPGVFWMWWNPLGFAVTLAVGLAVARRDGETAEAGGQGLTIDLAALAARERPWWRVHLALVGWFVLTVALAAAIPFLARWVMIATA